MENTRHFKKALADFAFDAAYGDSIRHLHNSGYTPEEIKSYLGADSLTVERICEVIEKSEQAFINNACNYEIVKEYDEYGRSYFVKRKTSD